MHDRRLMRVRKKASAHGWLGLPWSYTKPFTMNTRVLLSGLASGVAGFLLGWILFGMLMMDY